MKKLFLIVVLLLAAAGFCYVNGEIEAEEKAWLQKTWIRYTNDVKNFTDAVDLEKYQIDVYKAKSDEFNHRVYYEKLSDNEKTVYNAFQYAYDKGYKYTYIDDALLQGSSLTAEDILYVFTLDNTCIQQNIAFDNYTYEPAFKKQVHWKAVIKRSKGTIIGVDNFTHERMEKVNAAVEKLRKLDFGFTESTSDYEKVSAIFNFVQSKLSYSEGVIEENTSFGLNDFLYQAVKTKETNCDGYATVFGVLCELNGVKCIDKSYTPGKHSQEAAAQEVGHTWSVVSVDGKWYNIDCTESAAPGEDGIEFSRLTRMGFEDALQSYTPDYDFLAPECGDNLIPLSAYYTSFYDSGIADEICEAIEYSENSTAVFAVSDYSEGDEKDVMSEVANSLWSGVSWLTHKTENYTVFCVSIN